MISVFSWDTRHKKGILNKRYILQINGHITSRDVIFHEDDFSLAREMEGVKGKSNSSIYTTNDIGIIRKRNRGFEIQLDHAELIHSEDQGINLLYC